MTLTHSTTPASSGAPGARHPSTGRGTMRLAYFLLALAPFAAGCTTTDDAPAETTSAATFAWETLPDLPRALGGQMAGTSHGALIVAGGTDFPTPLLEGGTKVWYDTVHVLDQGAAAWTTQLALPSPLAYAAAAVASDRLILAGGSDDARHHADVRALEWVDGSVVLTDLPPLPVATAMAGAAVIGRTFYVAGGQEAPDSADASRAVLALDLDAQQQGWQSLPPLPGPGRILPVVVAQAGQLIVASGASLSAGASGGPVRQYLTDAYAWRPETTISMSAAAGVTRGSWRRLTDVPRPVVAAPAAPLGPSHVAVFGGDDGTLVARAAELGDDHPGFSRDILAYHTNTDTWTSLGSMPRSLVTTMAVSIDDATAIVGGEDRPGHRSATVLVGRMQPAATSYGGQGLQPLATPAGAEAPALHSESSASTTTSTEEP